MNAGESLRLRQHILDRLLCPTISIPRLGPPYEGSLSFRVMSHSVHRPMQWLRLAPPDATGMTWGTRATIVRPL